MEPRDIFISFGLKSKALEPVEGTLFMSDSFVTVKSKMSCHQSLNS